MTSSCSTSRSMLAAMPSTVRMDVILTTGAKISLKFTPFFYWKPFTTMQALYLGGFLASPGFNLYTHMFWSTLFLFGSSVNSYMWFSCRESILSYMALNHFRLWVSSFVSSKLSGSPSSVNSTCSSSRNLRGGFLSHRGYFQPWFSAIGSSVDSSSEYDSGYTPVSVFCPPVGSVSFPNPAGSTCSSIRIRLLS